jgi:hypothetical protein
MAEKITISWDEVNSPAVDAKLRQATVGGDELDQAESGAKWTRFLYNTLVYSTLFGLVGGLVAVLVGEVFLLNTAAVDEEEQQHFIERIELSRQVDDGEISEVEYAQRIEEIERIEARRGIRSAVFVFYFIASVGMLLGLSLSIADPAMSRNLRGVLISGSVAISIALVVSMFGLCFVGFVYNRLGGGEQGGNLVVQIFARAVGWGLLGGFLSLGPGIVLKSWKRLLIGLAGGLMGGTLGGLLFDPISMVTQNAVVSRIVAFTAIGALAGLGTGLLEAAAKTGWVRVTFGLIAGKQFVLYKDTTYIGSSPQCEIYLFKDASISPRHAAIHKRGSGFELEDLRSTTSTYLNGSPVTRTRLKRGDQIQIGSTVLMFLERAKR